MENEQLSTKHSNEKLTNMPDLSGIESKNEKRFKIFAPMFENLFEGKMIYAERDMIALINAENLVITSTGFSATAKVIKTIRSMNYLRRNFICESWKFSAQWYIIRICGKGLVPYSGWQIWIEPNLVKEVEQLLFEDKIEEIIKLLE